MQICGASNQFPIVYGDGIFPQLSTIIARYSTLDKNEGCINTRLTSVRQRIEHIFGFHKNTFTLFLIPDRFCLLISGVESSRLIFNLFYLLNYFVYLNKTPNNFDLRPPNLEEYIPLDDSSHQWCNARGCL